MRAAREEPFGPVAPVFRFETVPFGGVKQSGIGREGSRHGLEAFLQTKHMMIAGP